MSLKCMPLLFLNMGSEMVYILQQRLKAQKIDKEKTTQVLRDILHILLNTKFLKELFKPQYICSRQVMRIFFEKLIHSSIMRLSKTSMDKLYALMTMTYKYQLQLCNGSENIVFITLNHLDCIREILPEDEKLSQLLDEAHRMVIMMYYEIPLWEQAMIRSCLLNFFQDSRVNVSLFLRENKQTEEGRFILFPESNYQLVYNGNPPGKIRYFETGGEVRSESFPPDDGASMYNPCLSTGNIELNANDRGTTLGTNMYMSPESLQVKSGGTIAKSKDRLPDEELRLLSALIISPEQDQQKGFDLNLFTDDAEEKTFLQDEALRTVTHIDVKKHRKTIIAAVADVKFSMNFENLN
ncbi:Organic solute transport protein 1 family protein [Acanthocheilonema viteae]